MSEEPVTTSFKRVNDFIGMSYHLVQSDKKELFYCQTRDQTYHAFCKFGHHLDDILTLEKPVVAYAERVAGDLHAQLVSNGFETCQEELLLDPAVFSAFVLKG